MITRGFELWSAINGVVRANPRKQSNLAQLPLILTLFAVLNNGTLTGPYRSGRPSTSTVGQLAPGDPALAVLQPIGSSLLGPTHRIDAVSGSHGSLHSVSPASALNHRPIHYLLTTRLIGAALSYSVPNTEHAEARGAAGGDHSASCCTKRGETVTI